MKPYYEDGAVTIYHGDAREVVRGLEPSTVDVLLTDPPYGSDFSGFRGVDQGIVGDGETEGFRLLRQVMHQGRFALKPDAHAYIFSRWDGWAEFYDAVSPFIPVRNGLIWWKNRGGMGNLTHDYATDYEVILYGRLGSRALQGGRDSAVLAGIPPLGPIKGRHHPTEKPVALLTRLLSKSLPPNGTVFDPFMGSGSSLIAARGLGGKAIGIEIEERYCEIAARRCRQEPLWGAA